MLLDQVLEGDAHFFLDNTGVVDMTTDTVKLGSLIPIATESSKPTGTSSANRGGDGYSLDVGDGSRTAEEANIRREGRF